MTTSDTDPAALRAQLRLRLQELEASGVWALPKTLPPADVEPATTGPPPARVPDTPPAAPAAGRAGALSAIAAQVAGCTACGLHRARARTVFGVGDPSARLMFVGEGPGREEDRRGEPFVGAAGQLLDRMIGAMGLERAQVYIANAVKCRPPENRNPEPEELACCRPFLLRQIDIVRPEVIVLLGRVAAQSVLSSSDPLSKLRGRFLEFAGIPVRCTYHPAFLLRQPENKRQAWEDLQAVMRLLAGQGS